MSAPTRFCPACVARNQWDADRCVACGANLATSDSYDQRLMWALDHPDTERAMIASQLLARRKVKAAIDRLIEATRSPDAYRAAAAARALVTFDDDWARAAVQGLRDHPSALVRRAVLEARG
jgi:HEAT repeat protein